MNVPSSRAKSSAIVRQLNAENASAADDRSLSGFRHSKLFVVNIQFSTSGASVETIEWDLHDLWHAYYLAAMNISQATPDMDRLAFQVIQAKEQGVLVRGTQVTDTQDAATLETTLEAITPDGKIWTDLPFLVPDMTAYWVTGYAKMSAEQRLNFAAFLAKLASVGLNDDRLSGIALIVLRDALETRRALGDLDDQQDEDPQRLEADVSIGSLLPAANVWLFTAGLKLIQLSDKHWNNCAPSVSQCGDLAQENGTADIGFSPTRWLFWLRRLDEIAKNARQAGKETLATHVQRMMDNMLIIVGDTESLVKKALDEAGGAVRYRPMMHCFGPPSGPLGQ